MAHVQGNYIVQSKFRGNSGIIFLPFFPGKDPDLAWPQQFYFSLKVCYRYTH